MNGWLRSGRSACKVPNKQNVHRAHAIKIGPKCVLNSVPINFQVRKAESSSDGIDALKERSKRLQKGLEHVNSLEASLKKVV